MFDFFFSRRLFTAVRYLSLPWILPFYLTETIVKKACGQLLSFYGTSKQVLGLLLKKLDVRSRSRAVKLVCEMAITEMRFTNLTWDLANVFDLHEVTDTLPLAKVYDQKEVSIAAPLRGKMVTSEVNFGFAVSMSEESKPVKSVSTIFTDDIGDLTEFTTSSVSNAVDNLEWAGYQRATSLVDRTPLENGEFDTLGAILDYTRTHDALMTYYYTDENNQINVTEIFGVEADPTAVRSSSPIPRNRQIENVMVDSGILVPTDGGKGHSTESSRRKVDKGCRKNQSLDSATKPCVSSSAISKSYPMLRKDNVSRQQGRKTRSSLGIPGLVSSSSGSDTDVLFVPERSRPNCVSESVSNEAGSSNSSE